MGAKSLLCRTKSATKNNNRGSGMLWRQPPGSPAPFQIMAFTFTKEERLCNKALIAKLFEKGNRGFTQFPFRFIWVLTDLPASFPIQVLLTVSKRNFPRANQRNRIKRQVRELYRVRKDVLYHTLQGKGRKFALMISYTGKEKTGHSEMEKVFSTCIHRLKAEFEKDHDFSVHRTDPGL
jgi:ribonuclease P protein component